MVLKSWSLTSQKNKGTASTQQKSRRPYPPTNARKHMQRKYYIMRGHSIQALLAIRRKDDFSHAKYIRRIILWKYPA